MQIRPNVWVTVHYRLSDSQGEPIENGERQMTYLHGGYGAVFEGIERALEGKAVGDEASVYLEPHDSFGDYDAELVRLVSRDALPEGLEAGMTFEGVPGEEPDGLLYTVTDFTDEVAVLDGNHPLAGLSLHFDLKVTELREATPEEIADELERAGDGPGDGALH